MTGFSASWLDLREPADRRARNPKLARALAEHFRAREEITVVDLGCGTGANLRATAPLFACAQRWTLIDADTALIDTARARLTAWADAAAAEGESLMLTKAGKRIWFDFRRVDLARDIDAALGNCADLVAASALFDLVSARFIARLAKLLGRRGCAFYAALTYDGNQRFTPQSEDDAGVLAAFNAHQRNDKGFGPAAGPDASKELTAALRAAGYVVSEGESPWRLARSDQALIAELAAGCAMAAGQTGLLAAARIDRWRTLTRTGAVVGHTDILALPG
jgi:SAM-dependent methyltransferase